MKKNINKQNSAYIDKQYIEVVKEQPLQDKAKYPDQMIDEIYSSNKKIQDRQIDLLLNKFKNGNGQNAQAFDSVKADVLLRDDFLDTYFKDTYVEWGMRQYMDKAKATIEFINSQQNNHSDSVDNLIANLQDNQYVKSSNKNKSEIDSSTFVKENELNMVQYFQNFCQNQKAFTNYKKLGIYNTAQLEQSRFNDKHTKIVEARQREILQRINQSQIQEEQKVKTKAQ
eukprot:403362489